MSKTGKDIILAYNHTDGACAAAVALVKMPTAIIMPTSMAAVGRTLDQVIKDKPRSIHACGIGVGNWDEAIPAAQSLRSSGTDIFWYCGRGYLDDEIDRFGKISTPIFENTGSNTAIVAKHFGLEANPIVKQLLSLALFDKRIQHSCPDNASPEQEDWLTLIDASIIDRFKFGGNIYSRTVEHLAKWEMTSQDKELILRHRQYGSTYALLGKSPAIRELRREIKLVAKAGSRPVLILGESGVGKEHVARLVHEGSGERSTGSFKVINCATFCGNEHLANSELFGHRKGAFTGANSDREGAFRAAHGGSLFLDELGELPWDIQAKLLRVVDDGIITPLGADAPLKETVDVRVIAATNRNLSAMIRKGTFRADLFHRLSTLRVRVPALRERKEDIIQIADETMMRLYKEGYQSDFVDGEIEALLEYDWPGNVRQLIKVIERSVLLDTHLEAIIEDEKEFGSLVWDEGEVWDECEYGDFEADVLNPETVDYALSLADASREYASRVLELTQGNKSQAAKVLDISRGTLNKLLSS